MQTEADVERNSEQWAQYEQAKAQAAAQQALAQQLAELKQLVESAPEVECQVEDLLARTEDHLEVSERLELALQTARRLRAEAAAQPSEASGEPAAQRSAPPSGAASAMPASRGST